MSSSARISKRQAASREVDALFGSQSEPAARTPRIDSGGGGGARDATSLAENSIQVEYRKRLADAKELHARLQRELQVVKREEAQCQAVRQDAIRALTEFQRPLSLSMQFV